MSKDGVVLKTKLRHMDIYAKDCTAVHIVKSKVDCSESLSTMQWYNLNGSDYINNNYCPSMLGLELQLCQHGGSIKKT